MAEPVPPPPPPPPRVRSQNVPSMGGDPRVVPSGDPVLSGSSLSQFSREQLQQNLLAMQAQQIASQNFTDQMNAAVQALSGMVQQIGETTRDLPSSVSESGSGSASRASQEARVQPAQPAHPSLPSTFRTGFQEGREQGEHPMSAARGMMRSAASRFSQSMSQRGTTWQRDPATGEHVQYDAMGQEVQRFAAGDPAYVQARQDSLAETSRLASLTGIAGRYAAGSGALGSLAGAEGTAGAIGTGLLRVAGPIGIAAGVAGKALDTLGEQTAQGAEFRAIYGQDAGRFAIPERFSRGVAGWEAFLNGMDRKRAGEVYQGSQEMGLRGDRLRSATSFDEEMYMNLGLGSGTTLRAIKMSADNTNISLTQLAEEIEKVSEAAVVAGKNSEEAVNSFLGVAAGFQAGVANTPGSVGAAEHLTDEIDRNLPSSLSRDEAVTQGLAGALTTNNIMLAAGPDYRERLRAIGSGDEHAMTGTINDLMEMALDLICGGRPRKERLRQQLQEMGRAPTLEEQQMLMNEWGINPLMFDTAFRSYGFSFPQGQQQQMFFSALAGDLSGLGSAAHPVSAPNTEGVTSALGQVGGMFTLSGKKRPPSPENIMRGGASKFEVGGAGVYQYRSGDQVTGTTGVTGDREAAMLAETLGYNEWMAKTGDRDLAIEALLSGKGRAEVEEFSGKDLDEARFLDSHGNSYTLAEILGDPKLASQLSKLVVQGVNKNDVRSLGEITGFTTSSHGSSHGEEGEHAAEEGHSTSGGKAVRHGGRDPAPSGGPFGAVLHLSAEARRFFKLTGPSEAQSHGVPPVGHTEPFRYGRD